MHDARLDSFSTLWSAMLRVRGSDFRATCQYVTVRDITLVPRYYFQPLAFWMAPSPAAAI
eukprot:1382704-Amorphochlora_amoeboformis.AAC.2